MLPNSQTVSSPVQETANGVRKEGNPMQKAQPGKTGNDKKEKGKKENSENEKMGK